MENEELRKMAEESLVRSADEISDDKEILEKLKERVIIIKENNEIEIRDKDKPLRTQILLYLSTKFIGTKILEIFSTSYSKTEEIAKSLNVSTQALSRPLGTLTKEYIDKTNEGYRIRAYKILEFLRSLEEEGEEKEPTKRNKSRKHPKNNEKNISKPGKKEETKFELNKEGLKNLADILEISEYQLRNLFFLRQDDVILQNMKLVSEDNPKMKQLTATLLYLLIFKYCYNVSELPASVLRSKLSKIKIPSLVNLTSNLHKHQDLVFHDAGPKGSHKNSFSITPNGEEYIKRKINDILDIEKQNE